VQAVLGGALRPNLELLLAVTASQVDSGAASARLTETSTSS